MYIPIYSKFIGGVNINQAINHVNKLSNNGNIWQPIFDLTQEGCISQKEIDMYVNQAYNDIDIIKNNIPRSFYALKASSFGEKENFKQVLKIIQNSGNIKILMDAEMSKFTKIEDYYINKLSETEKPVYKTYQFYRNDTTTRFLKDIDVNNIKLFKFVRGAYLHSEENKNVLYKSKESVDKTFDISTEYTLNKMVDDHNIHLMIATHNKKSIDNAINIINDHREISGRVYFSQLLGMGDNLSKELHEYGFQVSKYIPYGSLRKAVPYLMRRLVENYSVLKHILH